MLAIYFLLAALVVDGSLINVNKDCDEFTRLHIASQKGNENLVTYLLNQNVDINIEDNYGRTALIWASKNGHRSVVKLLIDSNADIYTKDNRGMNALHHASANGFKNIVKLLLYADTDEMSLSLDTDNFGTTPLLFAVTNGHLNVIKTFIAFFLHNTVEVPFDVKDLTGSSSMILASRYGHVNILKYFQKMMIKNYDFNETDKNNMTALDWAIEKNQKDVIEYLAKVISEPTYREISETEKSLIEAINCNQTNDVEKLLEKGVNIDNFVIYGYIPIIQATIMENERILELLLDYGANLDEEDTKGNNALYYAKTAGILDLLLTNGADVENIDVEGRTALMSASKYGNIDKVDMLIKYGADVNAKDYLKQTPLMHTVFENGCIKTRIIKLLLDNGANKEAKNWIQKTAAQIALDNGDDITATFITMYKSL